MEKDMVEVDMLYELKNGNGFVKEFDDYDHDLLFEGEYKNGEKTEREYYLVNMV